MNSYGLEAEVTCNAGDLAGVIGLDTADGDEGVAAGVDCFGDEVLQFADLVASEGDAGVAVFSFCLDLDLTAQCLAESWQWVDRGWAKEQRFAAEVVKAHASSSHGVAYWA